MIDPRSFNRLPWITTVLFCGPTLCKRRKNILLWTKERGLYSTYRYKLLVEGWCMLSFAAEGTCPWQLGGVCRRLCRPWSCVRCHTGMQQRVSAGINHESMTCVTLVCRWFINVSSHIGLQIGESWIGDVCHILVCLWFMNRWLIPMSH